jgi:hypothetical protein
LKNDLNWDIYSRYLYKVEWMEKIFSKETLKKISYKIKEKTYSAGEVIFKEN